MDMQKLAVELAVFLGPLILAISVHEFSHIAMAKWLGDDTGTRLGRFTLDPIKHIDPIWTIALPAILITISVASGSGRIPVFAAGKPAPYNPMRLTRRFNGKRITIRFAELLVALAGPVSNLVLAFISTCVLVTLLKFGFVFDTPLSPVNLAESFLYLNVSLFVFNLIPVTPLDGSKILISILPRDLARRYEQFSTQFTFILFGLLIFGGSSMIASAVSIVVNIMKRPFI